jgi:ferredoxin-NADP reductase
MSWATLFDATVLTVHHWTDRLFSFGTTREHSFSFESGQFAMIGVAESSTVGRWAATLRKSAG